MACGRDEDYIASSFKTRQGCDNTATTKMLSFTKKKKKNDFLTFPAHVRTPTLAYMSSRLSSAQIHPAKMTQTKKKSHSIIQKKNFAILLIFLFRKEM
jgi:hypothetical protein